MSVVESSIFADRLRRQQEASTGTSRHSRSGFNRFVRTRTYTWPGGRAWLLFVIQVLAVAMVEIGNDLVRGNVWRPDAQEAMSHARSVVSFEQAHGIFVEPALQTFYRHTHHLFGLTFTWPDVVRVVNGIYGFCHIFVTLAVVLWIFVAHRPRFPLVRNVTLLTNLVALAGYELYPMAPPRLTTGLVYHHHAFRFTDPMRHILGSGTLNGTPIGYNPLSAMPSLHVAWALIVGASLLWLARNPLLRALGVIYPGIMVMTVVITANHYLMDAVGAAAAVSLATAMVLAWTAIRQRCGAHSAPVSVLEHREVTPRERSVAGAGNLAA